MMKELNESCFVTVWVYLKKTPDEEHLHILGIKVCYSILLDIPSEF